MRVDRQGNRQETVAAVHSLCASLFALALTWPLATGHRPHCRLPHVTTEAAVLTVALWHQAGSTRPAAAIAREQRDYRDARHPLWRVYDVRQRALRGMELRDSDALGSEPWVSL